MKDEIDIFYKNLQGYLFGTTSELYSDKVVELASEPVNVGEIEDPDAITKFTGPCGDTMQIGIRLKDGFISEIRFLTDGCGPTLACGSAVTMLAKNRTPDEAKKITPVNVLKLLGGLPASHTHCAKLAVVTLQETLAALTKTKNINQ